MNFIVFFLLSTILSAVSIKPKFCIDCKHFKNGISINPQYGKCSLFPKIEEDINNVNFLVSGKRELKKIEYTYCSISREYNNMCGTEGKYYEKKNKRPFFYKIDPHYLDN